MGSEERVEHQKGTVLYGQHECKINGDTFSDFIKTHFLETFSCCGIPKSKVSPQGRCPLQNSKREKEALDRVAAKLCMPPCSPDFNPIENISNYVKVNYILRLSKVTYIIYKTLKQELNILLKTLQPNILIKLLPKTMLMIVKSRRHKVLTTNL